MTDSAEEERQKLSDRLEEWAALRRSIPKQRRARESEPPIWQQVVRCWNTEPHAEHDDGTRYFCPGIPE